jgi:hypothetical protein
MQKQSRIRRAHAGERRPIHVFVQVHAQSVILRHRMTVKTESYNRSMSRNGPPGSCLKLAVPAAQASAIRGHIAARHDNFPGKNSHIETQNASKGERFKPRNGKTPSLTKRPLDVTGRLVPGLRNTSVQMSDLRSPSQRRRDACPPVVCERGLDAACW